MTRHQTDRPRAYRASEASIVHLPVDSPSETLRRASASAHEATERIPILARLASGELSDSDYAHVMATFAALFEAVVVQIQTLPRGASILALTDLAMRTRHAQEDVRSLGFSRDAHALTVPFIRSYASGLGAAYALEGARHGGTMIGARLRRAGRPIGTPGYTFFDLKGLPVAEDWRVFKGQLDRALASQHDLDEAVLGARGAFALITGAFGGRLDG